MKKNHRCWWALALPGLALMACGEAPVGPEDAGLDMAHAFAKPDGKPGGGGKPEAPSGDIPLEVVFDETASSVGSDDLGAYVHEDAFVSAVIRDNGMLYFQSFDGKRRFRDQARGVTVDLSQQLDVHSQDDLDEFKAAVGDAWPVFTSDVTLHTRNADGGMYTMADGTTLVDGGKIGFNDYGDGDSWEWRLLFDTRVGNTADGVGLCITHPDADTWFVTTNGTDCGDPRVDSVAELWRVRNGVFVLVADFEVPLHLEATQRN